MRLQGEYALLVHGAEDKHFKRIERMKSWKEYRMKTDTKQIVNERSRAARAVARRVEREDR